MFIEFQPRVAESQDVWRWRLCRCPAEIQTGSQLAWDTKDLSRMLVMMLWDMLRLTRAS